MKLFCFILLFPSVLLAQLTTSSQSPASLVQNVLLGPGVTVSNIFYSGAPAAIGRFNASGTNLGINDGIVITTGTINPGGSGPHGPNNQTNSGVDNNYGGYNALSAQIGGIQTLNAAILEFDFVPYSDTVRFKYVFGSEEYPEYVGSEFNDVFAFFISGPGISGQQNIARLANGSPVAINNVNNGSTNSGPCTNCSQYVYNGTGLNAPFNGSNAYIQYDGFTRVLEAVSKVQCGKTYHLVIAIADAGDGIYDSGIFLEANSLTSKVPVNVSYSMSYDAFNDGKTMAEGCVNTTVTITRGINNSSSSLTVPISVSGTATEGLDYDNIPNSVTFAPGQLTASFNFSAFTDALTEGIETINLIFDILDPCGNNNPIPINLQINDIQPVSVEITGGEIVCEGEPVTLTATPSGGVGPYVFSWSTGETTQSISVTPTSTQTYSVTVTDNCLRQSASATKTVTVPVYPPLTLTTTPDIVEICPYVSKDLIVTPSGGSGGYSYSWTHIDTTEIGSDSLITVTPSSTTYYTIFVTDFCGDTISKLINYTISSPPLILTMSPDALICPLDSATVSVTATGGYGQYYYDWPQTGDVTPSITVNPEFTTTYTVFVSDECQTFKVEGKVTVKVIEPVANFAISSHTLFEDLPITFQNLTTGGVTYQWTFGDGNTSTIVHPNNTYDVPGTYYITLIATNEIGCMDTITKPITIQEEYWIYVPNSFTPDGDQFNNTFLARTVNIVDLEVLIYNRWGQLVFESSEVRFRWDGTYNGVPVQDGTYTYKIKYTTRQDIIKEIVGHVNVLR